MLWSRRRDVEGFILRVCWRRMCLKITSVGWSMEGRKEAAAGGIYVCGSRAASWERVRTDDGVGSTLQRGLKPNSGLFAGYGALAAGIIIISCLPAFLSASSENSAQIAAAAVRRVAFLAWARLIGRLPQLRALWKRLPLP